MALEFLLHEQITSFPIDPFEIIRRYGWKLKSYSDLALKQGYPPDDIDDIIDTLGSRDAVALIRDGELGISYNDLVVPADRIRFTLMHEIAHILLNHFDDYECMRVSRDGVGEQPLILERECDCFARNVLAPVSLVLSLRNPSKVNYNRLFGITASAWETRMDLLELDRRNTHPALLLLQQQQFREFMYSYGCPSCGTGFIGQKNTAFCPVCGDAGLIWRRSDMRFKDGYSADGQGRVSRCPKCGNTELPVGGDHCMICGSYLINRCTNGSSPDHLSTELKPCGKPAAGNARYCIFCGAETTFYRAGLLKHWSDVPDTDKEYGEDDSGEELPF